MALALFNPFVSFVVRRQSPSHGLTTPVDRKTRRHGLILIVPFSTGRTFAIARVAAPPGRETGCVCLHALSSFQRTDRSCAQGARPTFPAQKARLVRRRRPRLGEPSKVTRGAHTCQPRNGSATARNLVWAVARVLWPGADPQNFRNAARPYFRLRDAVCLAEFPTTNVQ